jgi:cytochrome b6-f complex iron-sulfur subunit
LRLIEISRQIKQKVHLRLVSLDFGRFCVIKYRYFLWERDGAFMESSRRNFLVACLGGIAAAGAGSALYPVYKYLAPQKTGSTGEKVTISDSDLLPGGAKFFDFRGETGVIVRKKSGELIALSAVCSHLGCIVQWEKDKQDFLCPCHAGRYTEDGVVISGPPPRSLTRLPFTVAGGAIIVG